MVWTVFRIAVKRLLQNRAELILTFVVPIAFFSIFALIFGNGVGSQAKRGIKAVVVDQAKSPTSQQVIRALDEAPSFVRYGINKNLGELSADQARDLVRIGKVTVAVVLKNVDNQLEADLLIDASDQVSGQLTKALLEQLLVRPPVIRTAAKVAINSDQQALFDQTELTATKERVHTVDVMAGSKQNPVISMYAAGIAVMFLLFGATSGGGSLLEERESQTLDRLMITRLTMDQLLIGKWLFQIALGMLQVSVMFVWGWLVFSIDLWSHLDGFLTMSIVTTAAAASFGLLLATVCRSRGQLNGLSVIVVLTMSALGGSMVPRYLMSDSLREAGMFTFNAWALDGYDKVFWRELPIANLWPQVSVLMLCSAVMLVSARLLAIRWESA